MKSINEFLNEGRKRKEEEQHIEGVSILDKILNDEETTPVDEFVKEFIRPNGPTIYAFITDKVKDAIKVGYTDQHPEKRIAQWKEVYGKEAGEVTCLGYWSSEEFNKAGERVFFWDHAIHKKIRDKGYKQLDKDEFMATLTDEGKKIANIHFSREFFSKYKKLLKGELSEEDKEELSAQLIEDIIKQMKLNIKEGTNDFKLYSFDKEGKTSGKEASTVWGNPDTYVNTSLQEDAIKNGVEAIKKGKKNILMAAVMRFGKTHAAYEIIKETGLKKVIVCSAKADVRKAWRDDINHVHFYKDFVFIEVKDKYKWDITHFKDKTLVTEHVNVYEDTNAFEIYKDKTLIFFFTLHDLGGSVKDIKAKHEKIFNEEFDLMVVDETHYGSHANTFGDVTKLKRKEIESDDNSDIEEEQTEAKELEKNIKKLDVKYKQVLQVSGTPYYILASNEMIEDDAEIISRVSYSDMLKARDEWEKKNPNEDPSKSPYYGIPTLHKIGLRLNSECRKRLADEGISTSISALFKQNGKKFKYEKEIEDLMKSVFGNGKSNSLAFLKNKSVEGNKVCKHTLIVLPRISACEAMKDLLMKFIDTKEREIFCIVGSKPDVTSVKELNEKLVNLDDHGKKSIILTVNKYLTGVSMPCVDSMIYLKNASSPQEYDQNIFRLCTRYVKSVKDPDDESRSKKVNMKDNVYLIDFNIANMFNMIANSAKMKAAAEGDPRPETIKKFMKDDLGTTPIFCEDGASKEITGKMEKINPKDLMEIYAGYNKNKSIADIVNDEINLFDLLFMQKNFQDIISNIDIEGDKSKLSLDINDEGDTDISTSGSEDDDTGKTKEKEHLKDYIKNKDNKKIFQLTKEKFKAIVKNLLYCNICLDEPCMDIESIVKKTKEDKDFKQMLAEFKVSIGDVKKAYDAMGINYKQAFNSLLTRMVMLAHDTSESGYEKFNKALQGLGRLDKNEVVTPPEIVEKMIDKLDKSDYEKADSILLVNEKQAEFFMGIYKKFGKKIAEKCKIVASSEIGKHLCKKMLKSVGVNDYINNIINIDDVDGNGKYDVNDFLNMNNEDILEMNNGKKFDICLMNPPYSRSSENIHLKFADKCLDIADKQISIFPISFITKHNIKSQDTYKEKWNDKLVSIEEVPSKLFVGTAMANCGIYYFDNKKEQDTIDIHMLNSDNQKVNSLLDLSKFNNYEQQFEQYFKDKHHIAGYNLGYFMPSKHLNNQGITDKEKIKEMKLTNAKECVKKLPENKVFLICNAFNGGMNAKFFTPKNGQIIKGKDKLIEYICNIDNVSNGYNALSFDSKDDAENCKDALNRPLLRFLLYRLQQDQRMTINKCYKYVPDIDWEDDRVKTDKGLLEVCGCPKDKCKEYAEYCKKIIDEVDKK